MGDRCYMRVETLRKFKHEFEELGFLEELSEGDFIRMVDEEANWAHDGDMPVRQGMMYTGFHCAGDSYDAHMFACEDEEYKEVLTTSDLTWLVPADDNGNISVDDMVRMQAFASLYKRVNVRLEHAKNEHPNQT
jgi:hypothetical protein